MNKIRYEPGVMDVYPIVCIKTEIENSPFFQVSLKTEVDSARLYEAVKEALKRFPVFACTVKYDGKYYFETNDREFILINKAPPERPTEFGDNTNGFLWQICYYENTITFEWSHGVTDGKGGCEFFSAILLSYFDVPCEAPFEYTLEKGLESIYDENEKGIPQKKQPAGFKASELAWFRRGYTTDCHILRAPMSQVLSVAKKNDASPASVLPPLFSMALRRHISPDAKNRNVSCSMPVDCRGVMKKTTMQNFIVAKNITYVDKYDKLDFALVSTIYRAFLDLAVQPENIIKEATDKVKLLRILTGVRPAFLQRLVAGAVAKLMKHSESNFTFTYLGKLQLPEKVMNEIQDFYFRSWHDFGECNIAAVDVNGMLTLNICENYVNKQIIPSFIEISRDLGIDFVESQCFEFTQANLRIKGL